MPQARNHASSSPVFHQVPALHGAEGSAGERIPLQFGPHPAAPHAVASTDGSSVWLNVGRHRLAAEEWLWAIGHELAHLEQQRQGRVRATGWLDGVAINDDAALEQEADRLAPVFARCLAAGFMPALPAVQGARPRGPILQNTIGVRGRAIPAPSALTHPAQALLQLIPGGAAWLASIAAASTQYNFANDLELLAGIQAGVHGDPVMMLRKMQIAVHPEALIGFNKEDMESLVAIERGSLDSGVARARLRRLFLAQGLHTESDLQAGDEFPAQVGLAGEPLFGSRSLQARISLFNLAIEGSGQATQAEMQKEAANFAVGRSMNLAEFIDYYRFYMALLPEDAPDAQLADKRARRAEATADSLSEVSFNLLWAPTLESAPAPAALPGVISQWSERGLQLGFPRLSAALAYLVQNVALDGATGHAARRIIQEAMSNLQQLWVYNVPRSVRVSQSGEDRLYSYELPTASAQLSLSSDGTLTVANFRPHEAKPATA